MLRKDFRIQVIYKSTIKNIFFTIYVVNKLFPKVGVFTKFKSEI